MTELLGRFGWRCDPAVDFEIEVQDLEATQFDLAHGISNEWADFRRRIDKAMEFRVGGVPSCISAKALLRELAARAPVQP